MDERPYTIVVGVSATSKSRAALAWAHAQCGRNGGHVIAVRAWRMPNPQATPSGEPAGRLALERDVQTDARELLEADVADVCPRTTELGAASAFPERAVRGIGAELQAGAAP